MALTSGHANGVASFYFRTRHWRLFTLESFNKRSDLIFYKTTINPETLLHNFSKSTLFLYS